MYIYYIISTMLDAFLLLSAALKSGHDFTS